MIINAHGFKKITSVFSEKRSTLRIGEFFYIRWPGRLDVDVCRRSEDEFEITVYSAKKSDVARLSDELRTLIHEAS